MPSLPINQQDSEAFRQFQYAEVIDPLYPQLRSKALPIASWEVSYGSNQIVGVAVFLNGSKFHFDRSQVRLFRGDPSHVHLVTAQRSAGILARLRRVLTFPHMNKF
jgi:hypothetical protein